MNIREDSIVAIGIILILALLIKDTDITVLVGRPGMIIPLVVVTTAIAVCVKTLPVAYQHLKEWVEALNDERFMKTIGSLANYLDECDDETRSIIQNNYMQLKKKNMCFGKLFCDDEEKMEFLAFSDEISDLEKIGKNFQMSGKKRVYCQYTFEQIRKILPLERSTPLGGKMIMPEYCMREREKGHQTCAERKILAKVQENYYETMEENKKKKYLLNLYTPMKPCEDCLSLIEKNNGWENCDINWSDFDFINVFVKEREALLKLEVGYADSINILQRIYDVYVRKIDNDSKKKYQDNKDKNIRKAVNDLDKIFARLVKPMIMGGIANDMIWEMIECQIDENGGMLNGMDKDHAKEIFTKMVETVLKSKKQKP